MPKILTIFNLVAGGASIAGLYVSLFTQNHSWILLVFFVITAALCAYVLFVPGNPLETNVENKLINYKSIPNSNQIAIQKDDFNYYGSHQKSNL